MEFENDKPKYIFYDDEPIPSRWYKSLLKAIKNRMMFYQLTIKKDNKHFLIIDTGIEDVVIPKRLIDNHTVIYFVKDKKVVDKYINRSRWKNDIFDDFILYFWARQTENLNKYDNL